MKKIFQGLSSSRNPLRQECTLRLILTTNSKWLILRAKAIFNPSKPSKWDCWDTEWVNDDWPGNPWRIYHEIVMNNYLIHFI